MKVQLNANTSDVICISDEEDEKIENSAEQEKQLESSLSVLNHLIKKSNTPGFNKEEFKPTVVSTVEAILSNPFPKTTDNYNIIYTVCRVYDLGAKALSQLSSLEKACKY